MRNSIRMLSSKFCAVIVDKDNAPKWDPPTPEGVTDDLLDAIFAPLPHEWTPL